jgi:hypothetical protein
MADGGFAVTVKSVRTHLSIHAAAPRATSYDFRLWVERKNQRSSDEVFGLCNNWAGGVKLRAEFIANQNGCQDFFSDAFDVDDAANEKV